MLSCISVNQYSAQYSFKGTDCFHTQPSSKEWIAEIDPVSLPIINPRTEYPILKRHPILKSCALSIKLHRLGKVIVNVFYITLSHTDIHVKRTNI